MRMSYAQNLEDYHLDLAFAGQQDGVYVDVGGGHPVADNVSYWFYLKGWRGLVVEPQTTLADAYIHSRPRDIVYRGLAGASDGRAQFHEVAGLHGLSSMKADMAREAERFGAGFTTVEMPLRRLDGLIDEAGLGRIDFLKIDVEGAEADVLAGLDLSRVRPRVIVLETVNPANPDGAAGAWEKDVLAAGYRFRLFDRLNRFYVAAEDADVFARLPETPADWGSVDHLWNHGPARDKSDGCDHHLARTLEQGFYALLPSLSPDLIEALLRAGLKSQKADVASVETIRRLVGSAEWPGRPAMPQSIGDFVRSEQLRAALARTGCFYDGGHIIE